MRALRVFGVLVLCLLVPGLVAAQTPPPPVHTSGPPPTVYVCTAGGQVVAVNGGTGAASVLFPANFTSDGTFNDCVIGPDGWLYIAKANQIVRINPSSPGNSDDQVATLPSSAGDARGLSFNITTLYI